MCGRETGTKRIVQGLGGVEGGGRGECGKGGGEGGGECEGEVGGLSGVL